MSSSNLMNSVVANTFTYFAIAPLSALLAAEAVQGVEHEWVVPLPGAALSAAAGMAHAAAAAACAAAVAAGSVVVADPAVTEL